MITAILTHEVKNFQNWKKAFDADSSNRSAFNIRVKNLFQSADDENMVTIIAEASSPEDVKKFIESPELRRVMENAGVISRPEVKILTEVRVLKEA